VQQEVMRRAQTNLPKDALVPVRRPVVIPPPAPSVSKKR
jgi:hypothetical protein